MTTTAFDDQFTPSTQTIEIVHAPYEPVAILKRNVADLEVALKQQTERAEAAEEKLTTDREDMQSWIDSRNGWMERAGAAEAELAKMRKLPNAKMNAPSSPTDEQIHAAYRNALGQSIRERDMPEIRKFSRALLQSSPQAPAVPAGLELVDGSDDYYEFLGSLVESHPAGVMRHNTDKQSPAMVPAYLLERQENGLPWYISAVTSRGGAWHWTADVNAAIRFSRKDDAIACWDVIARHVGVGGSGTTETTPKQHIFEDARALLQSAEVRYD